MASIYAVRSLKRNSLLTSSSCQSIEDDCGGIKSDMENENTKTFAKSKSGFRFAFILTIC